MQTRSEPCAPSVLWPLPAPTRLPAKRRATPRRAPHRTCPLSPTGPPPAGSTVASAAYLPRRPPVRPQRRNRR